MLQDEHHNRMHSYKWYKYVVRYRVVNNDGTTHIYFDYIVATCTSHVREMFKDMIPKKRWWGTHIDYVELLDVFEKKGYYIGNYQGRKLTKK